MSEEQVILVDANDTEIGTMGKMEVHKRGLLHRAFSIFVFSPQGEMLLQKRASSKYHSGGLWSNSCCGHPRPGESIQDATNRRLMEELGIRCDMRELITNTYNFPLDEVMTEHELNHVCTGTWEGVPNPNVEEVEDWKFISLSELEEEIRTNSGKYTSWFKHLLKPVLANHKPA